MWLYYLYSVQPMLLPLSPSRYSTLLLLSVLSAPKILPGCWLFSSLLKQSQWSIFTQCEGYSTALIYLESKMYWNRDYSCENEVNHGPCSSGEDPTCPALGRNCKSSLWCGPGCQWESTMPEGVTLRFVTFRAWRLLSSSVSNSQLWHTSCETRVKNNVLLIVGK